LNAVANLNAVVAEMICRFVARVEYLSLLERSIVADCNMLVIGLPDTAKSELFSDFFSFL
jgi:hypothetical protein